MERILNHKILNNVLEVMENIKMDTGNGTFQTNQHKHLFGKLKKIITNMFVLEFNINHLLLGKKIKNKMIIEEW